MINLKTTTARRAYIQSTQKSNLSTLNFLLIIFVPFIRSSFSLELSSTVRQMENRQEFFRIVSIQGQDANDGVYEIKNDNVKSIGLLSKKSKNERSGVYLNDLYRSTEISIYKSVQDNVGAFYNVGDLTELSDVAILDRFICIDRAEVFVKKNNADENNNESEIKPKYQTYFYLSKLETPLLRETLIKLFFHQFDLRYSSISVRDYADGKAIAEIFQCSVFPESVCLVAEYYANPAVYVVVNTSGRHTVISVVKAVSQHAIVDEIVEIEEEVGEDEENNINKEKNNEEGEKIEDKEDENTNKNGDANSEKKSENKIDDRDIQNEQVDDDENAKKTKKTQKIVKKLQDTGKLLLNTLETKTFEVLSDYKLNFFIMAWLKSVILSKFALQKSNEEYIIKFYPCFDHVFDVKEDIYVANCGSNASENDDTSLIQNLCELENEKIVEVVEKLWEKNRSIEKNNILRKYEVVRNKKDSLQDDEKPDFVLKRKNPTNKKIISCDVTKILVEIRNALLISWAPDSDVPTLKLRSDRDFHLIDIDLHSQKLLDCFNILFEKNFAEIYENIKEIRSKYQNTIDEEATKFSEVAGGNNNDNESDNKQSKLDVKLAFHGDFSSLMNKKEFNGFVVPEDYVVNGALKLTGERYIANDDRIYKFTEKNDVFEENFKKVSTEIKTNEHYKNILSNFEGFEHVPFEHTKKFLLTYIKFSILAGENIQFEALAERFSNIIDSKAIKEIYNNCIKKQQEAYEKLHGKDKKSLAFDEFIKKDKKWSKKISKR
ncbi:hypothetical protein EDEG_03749 [Edhazardia aedis USNM 41457]|uniref:Uncharacterized protein n=1 Tax=Edhazardia aedis (strain USNM 41457) TaxID=1003232 RepID=J8ZPW4_EDHAE|nr:hypothetical protein EDEG_03749 [Edhazardia aedis USNM 41457]|eukprot:EJW01733.1 hypothetical protein EDEG_03749 [Edhazardia aedis USNM 41457]